MKINKNYLTLLALSTMLFLSMNPISLNAYRGGYHGGDYHGGDYRGREGYGGYGGYHGYHQDNNSTVVVPWDQNNGYYNDNDQGNYDPMEADPETQGGQIFDSYDPNNR